MGGMLLEPVSYPVARGRLVRPLCVGQVAVAEREDGDGLSAVGEGIGRGVIHGGERGLAAIV